MRLHKNPGFSCGYPNPDKLIFCLMSSCHRWTISVAAGFSLRHTGWKACATSCLQPGANYSRP
jgi:hypothetical protein